MDSCAHESHRCTCAPKGRGTACADVPEYAPLLLGERMSPGGEEFLLVSRLQADAPSPLAFVLFAGYG